MKVKEIITSNEVLAKYDWLQKQKPECVSLFHIGGNYECYEDDAEVCGRILDLNVSTRKEPRVYKVVSFPCRALDVFLPKLLRNRIRVAVTDFL